MAWSIEPLSEAWLDEAARVHSLSWKESHRAFCSEAFVAAHTQQRQRGYLLGQMAQGKRLYVLHDQGLCLGLISEQNGLIENLYVDPAHYRQGVGRALLAHVCAKHERPTLWVLSNNARAIALYGKAGFRFTGREKQLTAELAEREMVRMTEAEG